MQLNVYTCVYRSFADVQALYKHVESCGGRVIDAGSLFMTYLAVNEWVRQ